MMRGGVETELTVKRILVADSEMGVRESLTDFFVGLGYWVDGARNAQDVLDKAATSDYAVILIDCRLSGNRGLEVLTELSALYPDISVIMLSAESSLEIVTAALRKGAFDFVIKPIDVGQLTEIMQRAWEHHELTKMYQDMCAQVR